MHVSAYKRRLSNRFSKHLRLHERGSRWRYGYLWLSKMKVFADWLLHWQRTHGAFSTGALSRNGQILQNRAKTLVALPSLSHPEVCLFSLLGPSCLRSPSLTVQVERLQHFFHTSLTHPFSCTLSSATNILHSTTYYDFYFTHMRYLFMIIRSKNGYTH